MNPAPSFVNHVMLADDDSDACLLFERTLAEMAPSIYFSKAHDGDQLLRMIRQTLPDILFLDLNMPCKTGFDCLQEIRSIEEYKGLRVIIFSSSARMSDIVKSYAAGADLFIVKPFRIAHLKNAVGHVLEIDWNMVSPVKTEYFINNRFVPFTSGT